MLKNWKTTLSGVAMILAACGDAATQFSTGDLDGNRLLADAMAVVTGVGLIAAKDAAGA